MACPLGTNNCKRYRQISLVEMCKIPKVSQSQSGSTNNTDHEAHLGFEQPIEAYVESVDLDEHEIVIGADLLNLSCLEERYVPLDCNHLPFRTFGKNKPINLKPQKHWFETFDFLHYVQERDIVICYPCAKTLQERKFPNNLKIEPSFTDSNIGFCNWKKAIEKFNDHKKSQQYKVAVEVQLYIMKQGTISSQLDVAMLNSQEQWRSFLIRVITSLKFLGECALPVRGHVTDSGLLFKLMKLRSTDSTSLSKCLSSSRLEYMSPDIQNEIIQLLAHDVQRRISEELRNLSTL